MSVFVDLQEDMGEGANGGCLTAADLEMNKGKPNSFANSFVERSKFAVFSLCYV